MAKGLSRIFSFFLQEIPENEAVENVQVSSSSKWIWKDLKNCPIWYDEMMCSLPSVWWEATVVFHLYESAAGYSTNSRFTSALAEFSASVGTPPPFQDQGADAAPKAV